MSEQDPIPVPGLDGVWPDVLRAGARDALAAALLAYVRPRRWFRAKARAVTGGRVVDVIPLGAGGAAPAAALAIVEIAFRQGDAERYLVPLAPGEGGAVLDGLATGQAAPLLMAFMRDGRRAYGEAGTLQAQADGGLAELLGREPLTAQTSTAEQSNSNVVLADRVLLKTYRQLTVGENPEVELGRYLSAHPLHPPTPRLLGSLSYRDRQGGESSVAVAHQFLPNDGDAWSVTLEALGRALDEMTAAHADERTAPLARFVVQAETLGRRTAELHLALADVAAGGAADDPALRPEPLGAGDRAAAADGVRSLWRRLDDALPARLPRLPAPLGADVQRLLEPNSDERARLVAVLHRFAAEAPPVVKTRVHGDLHLGQVLCRGDDFVIVDFEGEPARPLAARRAKASPLRDVVGMLRSFDYAPEALLRQHPPTPGDPERATARAVFAAAWKRAVGDGYLRGYRQRAGAAPFLPAAPFALALMLRFYELERVLYEIDYEMNNRPDWIDIPLRGLVALAKGSPP